LVSASVELAKAIQKPADGPGVSATETQLAGKSVVTSIRRVKGSADGFVAGTTLRFHLAGNHGDGACTATIVETHGPYFSYVVRFDESECAHDLKEVIFTTTMDPNSMLPDEIPVELPITPSQLLVHDVVIPFASGVLRRVGLKGHAVGYGVGSRVQCHGMVRMVAGGVLAPISGDTVGKLDPWASCTIVKVWGPQFLYVVRVVEGNSSCPKGSYLSHLVMPHRNVIGVVTSPLTLTVGQAVAAKCRNSGGPGGYYGVIQSINDNGRGCSVKFTDGDQDPDVPFTNIIATRGPSPFPNLAVGPQPDVLDTPALNKIITRTLGGLVMLMLPGRAFVSPETSFNGRFSD
jgi:hypothetical protein